MSRLTPTTQHPLKHLLDLVIGVLPLLQYFYSNDELTEMYFNDDDLTQPYEAQDF
jgi:hypothetical protein